MAGGSAPPSGVVALMMLMLMSCLFALASALELAGRDATIRIANLNRVAQEILAVSRSKAVGTRARSS